MKASRRNAIVAQSGGPSPVINSSLLGVIDGCREYPQSIGTLYAAWHGVEGILLEQLIDLAAEARRELELLRTTTSAGAIGTCRYKLTSGQEEDFQRILDVLRAHEVGYFFYIGGNDSMDTAYKVSHLAADQGYPLVAVGVPKTIDNDVGDPEFRLIDHTPGYGSAARYWASIVQNVEEENRGMCSSEPVAVLQAMGRKSGWIPAAARLADPERRLPLQMYFAEGGHNLESLAENVNGELERSGRCIVVVSEGFDVGSLGEVRDSFGNIEYGASQSTVVQAVVNHLNRVGLASRGYASGQSPGLLQRSASIFASTVDIEEAYQVGREAVRVGVEEGSGWMATILRVSDSPYRVRYDKVPLEAVAGSARQLPPRWLSANRLDVTDDFIRYARPLIGELWPAIPIEGGLQRFARLQARFVQRKLPDYLPVRFRNKGERQ